MQRRWRINLNHLLVFRDTDAQQTISANFYPEHQLHAAVAAAKAFVA